MAEPAAAHDSAQAQHDLVRAVNACAGNRNHTAAGADSGDPALMRWRIPANRTDGASRRPGGCSRRSRREVQRCLTRQQIDSRGPSPDAIRHSSRSLPCVPCPPVSHAQRARVELNGTWEFQLDPQDQGDSRAMGRGRGGVRRGRSTCRAPGRHRAWASRRARCGTTTPGAAWYRRTVAVPAAWRGKSVTLRIGGAHRETTLFVNGQRIGEHQRLQRAVRLRRDRRRPPGRRQRDRAAHRQPGRRAAGGPARAEAASSRPAC